MSGPSRVLLSLAVLASLATFASARSARWAPAAGTAIDVPAGNDGAPSPPLATKSEGTSPDGVEVAGWSAGASKAPSDPAAWGGERPEHAEGQALSQRVASYALKATLDPEKHTVEGSEHLRWWNRSDRPMKSLYFHLYLNAFEGRQTTFMLEEAHEGGGFRSDVETKKGEWGFIDLKSVSLAGKPATFVYVHPDGGPETDHTVVRVDLPEAIAPGATGELDLAFHDQLPRVVARTGYFKQYHLVAQWFPKVGVLELPGERGVPAGGLRWNCHELHVHSEFYADFGTYRAELTAPKDYVVGATGIEQGAPREAPGGLTHTFAQDDVHDFAWTAWNRYAAPLKGTYDGPGSPHVDVEVLYGPENERAAHAALDATVDSLKYFSETLGPYPYPHVTVVVPPYNAMESGGMEYETFFTTFGGEGVIGSRSVVYYVTVHEFGHGYFMGLLASNEFEEPFLDEGMNELWDSRMMENDPLRIDLPTSLGLAGISLPPIGLYDLQRMPGGGAQRFAPDPVAGNSWARYSAGSFELVYPHTVVVFHDLEARLGGDALARGMKLYYTRWHHRHPGTGDLRAALAEGTGQPDVVNDWFERHVYADEAIDDRVVTVKSDEVLPQDGTRVQDGKRIEKDTDDVEKEIAATRESWKKAHPKAGTDHDVDGPFPFRSEVTVRRYAGHVPERVVVSFADGSTQTVSFPVEDRWHRYFFDGPKVVSAQLDPDRAILLDLNKLDDGRTRESDSTASTRWALEASNVVELALSLLVTQ